MSYLLKCDQWKTLRKNVGFLKLRLNLLDVNLFVFTNVVFKEMILDSNVLGSWCEPG